MKICPACNQSKSLTEFFNEKTRKDGKSVYCKPCQRERNARRYQKRKVKLEAGLVPVPEIHTCRMCKETKPNSEFSPSANGPDGLSSYCLTCMGVRNRKYYQGKKEERKEYSQTYKKNNPDKVKKWGRDATLRKYGLDEESFEVMMHAQGEKCKNPGCRVDIRKKPCIDHCHKTGKLRGILCDGCNKTLGIANDNPKWLEGLAEYLKRFINDDGGEENE